MSHEYLCVRCTNNEGQRQQSCPFPLALFPLFPLARWSPAQQGLMKVNPFLWLSTIYYPK